MGHGKSLGKGAITDTAEWISQIMKAEKIDKINLAGVSIGAVMASDFANKYPGKLASLCCIGGYDINNFDTSLQKGNGKEQEKMMLKASEQWHDHEKDSKFIVFKGAGHIVNMDTPEVFNKELEKILK